MIQLEDIKIDEEFRNFLPTMEDPTLLRGKIELEGWSDEPITVWENHNILLDGHRRYDIWKERGDDGPHIRLMKFATREAAFYWVVNNQRARRNLTPEQERYLLGRKYTAEKAHKPGGDGSNQHAKKSNVPKSGQLRTSERIAKEEGVSKNTVENSENYANAVDNLHERGVVSKSDILSGAVKIPASKVIEASKALSNEEAKAVLNNPKPKKETCPTDEDQEPKMRGKGVALANEAINCLIRIPKNDPLRKRGFQIVTDWIKANK